MKRANALHVVTGPMTPRGGDLRMHSFLIPPRRYGDLVKLYMGEFAMQITDLRNRVEPHAEGQGLPDRYL